MSKKLENISIEVNELKGKSIPSWEVIIPNKKAIGIIEKVEGRYRATTNKSNNVLFSKSLESSINDLLSYFALHEK
ncbi:DUF2969 domain-containing protein [Lactobacillus jensenii]|jgi:hypothetical protein|uniref:DUF2969 domain-containing protein n=2 Tax=Lactobacillus TaxID=1578 RepID=A0A2I1XNX2_LACJE|nr:MULTISPECIES: DUF2969 domain-containing protein [Lactobacillus]EEU21156.1 hypothetical protein HMPREF0525_00090 [Lactobacillus jensenii 27-2-CHN]EEX24033.1 hypothetical protein HMPREF0974_00621 [Lactobacillus jensenii 115-3-CHN]EFH29207.1 hypothetical protein HMPREF0526_10810 [Lactobacillus jensenii JV-V16]ERJ43866.1 hypothetical protein N581_08640 [Lactobacillus jensenii MD IIE-70(2)]APT14992.1 hypothetical protein BUE77_06015 [Lactobacillus jensenii]